MWGEFLTSHAWQLVSMAALMAGSAFFSGSETAMFTLSRGQLYRLRNAGGAGRIVTSLMARPRRLLNTLLLGNLLINVAYTSLAAVIVFDLGRSDLPAWAAPAGSVAGLVVLILVGEVTPKMVALTAGRRWAMPAAPALAVVQRALGPLLWVLQRAAVGPLTKLIAPGPSAAADISADELAAMLDLTARREAIDRDTSAMLKEIVSLTDLRTSDIMVPRVDMIAYDVSASRSGLVELFKTTGLIKIPVYDGDLDHIAGVIYAKRLLLSGPADLSGLVVPTTFVPESANLERLLVHFRANRTQLAIVVDEYGGTAGLVTLEDVLEEIVGEMPDPRSADRGPAVQRVAPDRYVLDGDLPIHEWADAFRMDLRRRRISTVGGFVTSLLGRIARVGDSVEYRNLRFTVTSVTGRRIDRLELQLRDET